MKINRNLLAGLANSGWSAVVRLAVVPFYLNFLGLESYGLVGFYVMLQAMFMLLDMGLATTISREVARNNAKSSIGQSASLLHTFAVIYWLAAVLIATAVFFSSTYVASSWINSEDLSLDSVKVSVALMGVVIGLRWPISLYQNAIIGAHKVTVASVINMIMISINAAGSVTVLAYISPTIEAFFIWQAIVGAAHTLVVRQAAWNLIGSSGSMKFSRETLIPIWKFTIGMGAVTITGTVLGQMDKIVLSRMLSLDSFALYSIASILAGSLLVLLTPVYNTIYPKFTGLLAVGDTETLIAVYRFGTRMLCIVLFPLAFLIFLFSESIILLWTGDIGLAKSSAPITSYLVFGFAINGIMIFPYSLQLAYGNYKLPLTITTILLCIQLPLVIALVSFYGVTGGALSWLILNILNMIIGTWLTHRELLTEWGLRWIIQDVMVPALLSTGLIYLILNSIPDNILPIFTNFPN